VSKPLVIIPTFLREPGDVDVTRDAVLSVRKASGNGVDILCVDDGSPEPDLVERFEESLRLKDGTGDRATEVHRKPKNEGFSKTVNVGLRRALDEGRDAILMNADVEIQTPQFHKTFQRTKRNDEPAAVAGALLMYPNGLIQHAGVYFSLLTRTFDHMFKYGPMNLAEARVKRDCPVTAAFQYIRHETLTEVGLYDEGFFMGWEDVDYCLRVMLAGKSCTYNPAVRAWHLEYMFRGRP